MSNFTRLKAHEITRSNVEISLMVYTPNITTNHAITYTNRHYFVENYDSQLKPNLSSKRFRLGSLFEDLDKTHEKLFPYFTHHHLIAL